VAGIGDKLVLPKNPVQKNTKDYANKKKQPARLLGTGIIKHHLAKTEVDNASVRAYNLIHRQTEIIMQDILDFISELKELQALYNNGDLRNFDFETKIQKYESKADDYDNAMDALFKDSKFYQPSLEV
jgi:hypothetical protein